MNEAHVIPDSNGPLNDFLRNYSDQIVLGADKEEVSSSPPRENITEWFRQAFHSTRPELAFLMDAYQNGKLDPLFDCWNEANALGRDKAHCKPVLMEALSVLAKKANIELDDFALGHAKFPESVEEALKVLVVHSEKGIPTKKEKEGVLFNQTNKGPKCWHCKKAGHKKNECPELQDESNEGLQATQVGSFQFGNETRPLFSFSPP